MAIQTIKATVQMRYGLEEDLEPDQLTTGEWAVSTDARYVRMCFAPGIVLRMATYEAFEQDMVEIQTILATCRDIQEAVERFEQLAELHKNDAASSALLSESWAHGETGIREGESEDNSKYWSEQSKSEADRAKEEADRASSIAGYDIDSELNETSTNPVQNKVITKEFNKKLNTDGDASNVLVNFKQSEDRINVASGENLSSFAGKVKKFFFDLKSAAFCDVLESVNITEPGFVMDGRTASEEFSELNRKSYWLPIISVNQISFGSVLKDTVENGVKFLAFYNPTDNPFSFNSGMAIAFQAGLRTNPNEFEIIGIQLTLTPVFEFRTLDLR